MMSCHISRPLRPPRRPSFELWLIRGSTPCSTTRISIRRIGTDARSLPSLEFDYQRVPADAEIVRYPTRLAVHRRPVEDDVEETGMNCRQECFVLNEVDGPPFKPHHPGGLTEVLRTD